MEERPTGRWSWGEADDAQPEGDADDAPGRVAAPTAPADEPPTQDVRLPPTDAPPVAPPAPPAAPSGAPSPGRGPRWAAVALVAAVLGALAGGAAATVLDDDDGAGSATPTFGSTTSRIVRPQDIQSILAKVQPGVVSIRTEAFQEGQGLFDFGLTPVRGAGTGMLLSTEGDVLTNAHVVAGAVTIQVTLFGETGPRAADLRGIDEEADLAVVRLRDTDGLAGRPVTLGSSEEMQVGDAVVAVGNAVALPGGPTVTLGIVSAKDRTIEVGGIQLSGLLQTDAAINTGNSGGPLVNAAGEVVGINTVVIQRSGGAAVQNIGFAIAVDTVKPLLDRLRSGAPDAPQGFLGVSTVTLTPEIRERFSLVPEAGAIIIDVVPGSPAALAGLQRNDVVTALGGEEISTNADLTEAVRGHAPGEAVEIEFTRDQTSRTTTVELGTRPAGG